MKKLISLVLAIMIISSLAVTSYAEEDLTGNYHVSTVNPMEQVSTIGTSSPSSGWNVATQGKYTFSGHASYSTLYLDYLLYGATYYDVYVTNYSSSTLTVNPHDSTDLNPFTVSSGDTVHKIFIEGAGKTYFLLSFNAPSNFSGSVSEWIYN